MLLHRRFDGDRLCWHTGPFARAAGEPQRMSTPPHPPAPAARLRLQGQPAVLCPDGPVRDIEAKDALMLAYLAIEGPTPRATLATLLWPEVDAARARANLRQRLFRLRQLLGVDPVCGSGTLGLAPGMAHDLNGSAGVLGALRFPDAAEFDAWLMGQRDQRASNVRQCTERQAEALERAGELAAALPVAQALLRLEPLSEAAHRRVMRLHYLRGDRSGALMAFDDCERTLKDEVGATPSTETLMLLRTVEQAHPHPWLPGQPLPASALKPPQLIGRASELAALGHAWAARQVFVLTGEAGAGKSRVLDAIAQATDGVLLVCGRPGDDQVPLATLNRLLQRLAERWPTLRTVAAYSGLAARMAGPLGHEPPTARSVAPMVAGLLQAACAVSGHGLSGLVLDDLQFADEASVDSWQELLVWPALAGLRFGFSSRIEGPVAVERIAAFSERSDAVVVPLPPLSGDAVQPFIESLALPLVDAGAVAATLVRRIGGNPLHLLETIRHALEKNGHLRADNLEAPTRVTELLEQRLLALPADGLLVVRIAAVAGDQFDPELAAAVSRRDVLELADAWHALEREGLLDTRGFMHDLIGEAALRLLPQPIARVLHTRVATHLAECGAAPARLAHHLLCAGDDLAAAPHLANAARQAWAMGRSRETRDAYCHAAAIRLGHGQPDAAFDLLYDCCEAMGELGPLGALDEIVEQLVPLARTPPQRARVALQHASSFILRGDHAGFLSRVDETLALGIAAGDRLVEAECRYGKGYYAAYGGRLGESIAQTQAAMLLYREIGRVHRAEQIEVALQTTLAATGRVRPALDSLRRTAQRLADGSSSVDLAPVLVRQADAELQLGDIEAARLSAHRALAALRATDMHAAELSSTASLIADVHRRCGDWTQAIAVIDEMQQRLDLKGDPLKWLDQPRAAVYLDLGRPDLAYRHIEGFADAAAYSAQLRQRVLILRWRYQLATGAVIDAAAALNATAESENLPMTCAQFVVAGQAAAPAVTPAQCAAVMARCESEGLAEQLLALRALSIRLQVRDGTTPPTEAELLRARQGVVTNGGGLTPIASLWLAQALDALGRPAESNAMAREGAAWLMARAGQSVPAEFRDSFLHRHPVHRALLALAGQ
jgi:DNA-binding SARP family transcriptional activator/tetratricopeptide (TPR) repeat protein